MPHWLLTPLGWLKAPFGWGKRKLAQHFTDRRELVREGSAILTPVSEFIGKMHPANFVWSEEAVAQQYRMVGAEWLVIRPRLLRYANQHPSDEVKRLGNELAGAVEKLLLVPLTGPVQSVESSALYQSAVKLNDEARGFCDKMLTLVRTY